ncbi:MAG: hypothetical protein Ct9H90mP28_5280 [Paracoccaceae bacterium]|nr:MAG: hypothetical protein Ct9H90mP28_5280 [Paracoccaceae bacterium]
MIFKEWKKVFLCAFIVIVFWLLIEPLFRNIESFQNNQESSSESSSDEQDVYSSDSDVEAVSSSDSDVKDVYSSESSSDSSSEYENEEDGFQFENNIYLSKENVESVHEDMSKYEELFPIIEMFKNKNLIVENIDGSIEYRDGDIDGIYFEGIDAFSFKRLKNYFYKLTSSEYFPPLVKKSLLKRVRKILRKNQNDKNGEKN